MAMSLRNEQSIFAYHVSRLIQFAYENGFELTIGEALRTPEMAEIHASRGTGIKNSNHTRKLAIDLNLFDGSTGEYLSSSDDHDKLGQYWKSLDPQNVWGGDFSRRDGNHYSRRYKDYPV